VLKDLENIQYESRASCSFIVNLSPELALKACLLFGPNKTEINFDLNNHTSHSSHNKIHLMVWQDRKYKSYEAIKCNIEEAIKNNNETIELSFTIHSTVESYNAFDSARDFENYARNCLKTLLTEKHENGLTNNKFQILKSRGVKWLYSQPSAPMETLYTEVEDLEKAYPYGPAYVDNAGLILAGDYFTQSSYVGCFCSAAAASRAVLDIINDRNKHD